MLPEDIDGAVALQRACFPPPFPAELLWNARHLLHHLQVFPSGQFIARIGSQVVGSASSLVITEENWMAHRPWEETVGGHYLRNHAPTGSTLYGVDISVHPEHRGKGVAKMLYRARLELVRSLGLRRFGTACRIPGLRHWVSDAGGTPANYVSHAVNGTLTDPTLTPLLRMGTIVVGIIEGYMDDEESMNCAALLEIKADELRER